MYCMYLSKVMIVRGVGGGGKVAGFGLTVVKSGNAVPIKERRSVFAARTLAA